MILKCKVEINNDLVTVVDYNGNLVQIPSIHNKDADFVNVWFDDGHYKVVADDFVESVKDIEDDEKPAKKAKKKTTSKD